MIAKSALVALLVAALAIVALGAPSNSASENSGKDLTCYKCPTNKDDPESCKTVDADKTPTEECANGCYEVSLEGGAKWERGCLESKGQTCKDRFPNLKDEDACATCTGLNCNNKNPDPTLKCYTCTTDADDSKKCKSALEGTPTEECANGCYEVSLEGGAKWERGCLESKGQTCKDRFPNMKDEDACVTCTGLNCNNKNPDPTLKCYTCTTDADDSKKCKSALEGTPTEECANGCYEVSLEGGAKWERGCLESKGQTCKDRFPNLKDEDACATCTGLNCNNKNPDPTLKCYTCTTDADDSKKCKSALEGTPTEECANGCYEVSLEGGAKWERGCLESKGQTCKDRFPNLKDEDACATCIGLNCNNKNPDPTLKCYTCTTDADDSKKCKSALEGTPTEECANGCYEVSLEGGAKWERGCLESKGQTCKDRFPNLKDEDACATCTGLNCNNKNPDPTLKCYTCTTDADDSKKCKSALEGTPTEECANGCYEVSLEGGAKWERGCLANKGQTCKERFPELKDEDACATCTGLNCNNKNPSPKLKCYSCTTETDKTNCKVVNDKTKTSECGTKCYAASSKDGEKWSRGCLSGNDDTCKAHAPVKGEEGICEVCEKNECNSQKHDPAPELMCYSCTTETDKTNCKVVNDKTKTSECGTKCYAASSKDGEKWSRGCLSGDDDTCKAHAPVKGEAGICEVCEKNECNSQKHDPAPELMCYSCTTETDKTNCKVVNDKTKTSECGTKCYAASSKDGEKWSRGCLSGDDDTCKAHAPVKGEEGICEVCEQNECNSQKHDPAPELMCYSCTTETDETNCKVVNDKTKTSECGTKCYAASSKDGEEWARGCLAADTDTCEAHAPVEGEKGVCEVCEKNECNSQKHDPAPELMCYSCTTEKDKKNCKVVNDETVKIKCSTKCYAASSKDEEKWSRGCLDTDDDTCKAHAPVTGEEGICEVCEKDECNSQKHTPPTTTEAPSSASSIASSLLLTAVAAILLKVNY